MIPVDFEGSNLDLVKPPSMTDDQCMSVRAFKAIDNDGFPFILTVWQPSYEDIEAIKAGRPICLKVIGETTPPVLMYTYDEKFNVNL